MPSVYAPCNMASMSDKDMNPYASPASAESQVESITAGRDLQALATLRTAVRWVGFAVTMFVLGCLTYAAFGLISFAQMPSEFAKSANLMLIGTVRQLVMAFAFGYLNWEVWRYSGLISAALRGQTISDSVLLRAQRACWYAVAGMALLYTVFIFASSAFTLAAHLLW